jgi:glycosyltransferase involved in cell wall biosynthesis
MKTEPKLSIVIPLYNMERFIEHCLDSLFKQDLPDSDFEIMVINDGSTDRSREIIERLQNDHTNLILISQENKGVSVARNKGISGAKGKYILFIDADDYLKHGSLRRIMQLAEINDSEVLFLNLSVQDMQGDLIGENDYSDFAGKVVDGLTAYRITHSRYEREPDRSWGIVFNLAFLKNNSLNFLPDVPYLEDGHFAGKVLAMAGSCTFDTNPVYIHRVNPGSVSKSNTYYTKKARNGFIKAALDLREFAENPDLTGKQYDLVMHLVAKFVISSVISSLGSRSMSEILRVKNELKQLGFVRLETAGLLSNKRYVNLYNLSFWLFILFFAIETRWRVLLNFIGYKNEIVSY